MNEKTARILATITEEQWLAIAEVANEKVCEKLKQRDSSKKRRLNEKQLYIEVSNILIKLGVPANIRGYQYLREAVVIVYRSSSYIYAITKELYSIIAKKYKTSEAIVELDMSKAIQYCFEKENHEMLLKYFKNLPENGELTNYEYIARLAYYLIEGNENV